MSQSNPTAEQILERWALPPEFDEGGKNAMRAKAAAVPVEHQAFGDMSDEWVADRVRMLMRDDIWHEPICQAGRDRIMRLSLEVSRLRADLDLLHRAGCSVREHNGHRFVEITSDVQL